MFLRKHVTKYRDKEYVAYRLCRTVREGGRVRQEVVGNLGKLSAKEAERIGKQLCAVGGKVPLDEEAIEQGPAYLYGGPLLVGTLMELAELEPLLRPLGNMRRRLDFYRTITVALCAQLLAPGSELKTSQWQRKLLSTQEPYQIPYSHFLRTLDVLADHQHQIEDGLFARVKHLFNQQVDVVFYDLTSSYFEGDGPQELAKRGYSRDGRSDRPQVVLGVATTKEGFPIAYRVHPGNMVDVTTVKQISADFGKRFEVDHCLVVGDSGLLSQGNTDKLTELGLGYLMGMRPGSTKDAREAIGATQGIPPAGQIGDVSYWPTQLCDGKAYVVLHSPGRHQKTKAILERKLATVRPKLFQLQRDVCAGKVRKAETIIGRATRILVEAKATPYFESQAGEGEFSWRVKAQKIESIYEDGGKYVLQTNRTELTAHEAAIAYRQLEIVEDSFRHLKHTLHLRPMYHRSPHRVMGHIGLCIIALFLLRLLEERLLAGGICKPVHQAIASVQDVLAVPLKLADRQLWPTPHVSTTAAAVFRAVGIPDVKARFQADIERINAKRHT